MSTYLTLVNNVLIRLNETVLDSSTFADARGIHGAAKIGVKNAINQINSQKWEWPFNYDETTEAMVVGTNLYSFEADYKVADWESFHIAAQTVGSEEIPSSRLRPIQRQEWYKRFRAHDFDNLTLGLDTPNKVFWYGSGQFGVTPVPDKAYVVTYNYWKTTTELSVHGDSTTVPENFNWVIERGALEDMYEFLDNDQRANLSKSSFQDAIKNMGMILIPQNIADFRGTQVNFGGERYYSNRFQDTF